jgi:hypothetical protein
MSDKFEQFVSDEGGVEPIRWISVKDRMPEHGSCCYIFCDDGECDSWVHYFTDDKRGKIWTSTDTGAPPISSYANVITHWMPHDLNAHKESEWHDISEVMPSLSGKSCMVLVDGELSPHCWYFGRSEGDNLLMWWCFGDNALYDGKNEYLLDENVITHWKRWRTPKPPKPPKLGN